MTDADGGREGPPSPAALARDGRPVFAAPWQARAFGIAVALHDGGDGFEWSAFQGRLADAIAEEGLAADDAAAVESDYYDRWLAALERLLVETEVLAPEEIERRAAAFAAGDRNAQEFIEGEHEPGH